MDEPDDGQLLAEYTASGSQRAFAALVRRHADLVYAAARRQCNGNAHLAEDVTQAVFLILARKAHVVRSGAVLPAWLIVTTRYAASNAVKLETRRRRHEQRAATMAAPFKHPGGGGNEDDDNDKAAGGDRFAPSLDEALAKLRENDRAAVTMRFLQGRSFRDVGLAMGVSEEAAQKRVMRAIEKLRAFFAGRGVTMESAALASGLTREASHLAPASLVPAVIAMVADAMSAGAAGAAGGAGVDAIASAAAKTMAAASTAKAAAMVAAALLLLAGAGALAVAALHAPPVNTAAATTTTRAPAPVVPSPLVPLDIDLVDVPRADVVTIPNDEIIPVNGANMQGYTYEMDGAVTRGRAGGTGGASGAGAPSAAIASRTPDLRLAPMPGMRGVFVPAEPWRRKRVEVSAYVRIEDVHYSAGLQLLVWGDAGRLLASAGTMNGARLRMMGTRGWTRMACVLDVPPDARRIELGAGLYGGGRVWLDSFQVAAVPESTPITSDVEWHLSTPFAYRLVSDPAEPRDGHPSARLESIPGSLTIVPGDGPGWVMLRRVDRSVDELRGKRVRIRAMIKSRDVAGGAGIFATAGHLEQRRLVNSASAKHDLPVRGTLGWMRYAATLDVPPDADMLEYGVRLEGAGTVWVDDVRVEPVDPPATRKR